jgi:Spy/CpxP family protein refolding chaperone
MLISILMVALLAAPSWAEGFSGIPGGRWWKDQDIQQQAGLSQAQVDQVKAIYSGHRQRMADLRAEMGKRQMELEDLLEAKAVDKAALGKKIDEVVAARAKLDRERMATMAEVRGVLSADQYAKLRSLQRQAKGGGGKGRMRGGGEGGGPCVGGGAGRGPGL